MVKDLLQIAAASWLIDEATAQSYLPLLVSYLNGQQITFDKEAEAKDRLPSIMAVDETSINPVGGNDLSCLDIPDNSIAIIPISGVLCQLDTMYISRLVRQAQDNPQIIAILFPTNSPGGMAFYIDVLANEIKACTKPTVTVVMGIAASAAMWLISATDYRFATSPMDKIGSVGIMTTITDMTGFVKDKLGIVTTEFYATKSTKKNNISRELEGEKKNAAPLIAELDFCNEIFHKAILENLCLDASSEVLSGDIYHAEQAIALGLIHEIGSLDGAVNHAYSLGLANKINSQISKTQI